MSIYSSGEALLRQCTRLLISFEEKLLNIKNIKARSGWREKSSMKENTVRVCFGLIIVICIAAVIVLAAIYGTRLNCHENDEELKKMKDALIPKMVQFKNIKSMTLDRVPGTGNASAYIKTIAFSHRRLVKRCVPLSCASKLDRNLCWLIPLNLLLSY